MRRLAQWSLYGCLFLATLMLLVVNNCFQAPAPPSARVVPVFVETVVDTTAIIVRISNYDDSSTVMVYLDALYVGRLRLLPVAPRMESMLIVPSAKAAGVGVFYISLEPVNGSLKPYRTRPIWRTPGRLTMVHLEVGRPGDAAPHLGS